MNSVLARIVEAGGTILEKPHLDSPGGEMIAKFTDPSGNVMRLYEEQSR